MSASTDQYNTALTRSNAIMRTLSPLKWFFRIGYLQGVFWYVMISVVSVSNDVLMRFLGHRLDVIQIVFFRFLFSALSVAPFMLHRGLHFFKTPNPKLHVYRAIFGVGAIAAACYGVNLMPLSENTTISFTQPLFFLPLALLFLHEKVDKIRWIASILGFLGIVFIMRPGTDTFSLVAFVPMTSAFLFACLDILAKKMVTKQEHSMTMLFYFGLGTTIAAFIPLLFVWKAPSLHELFLLFLLGIGANLIQVCLFLAFRATEASALAHFRYVELIFSALMGFLLFQEIPTIWLVAGGSLIILSSVTVTMIESKRIKAK